MNLGKLLAAGKSIMNVRTELSYRSSKQIYLPKFGPVKNPFKTETTSSVEENVGSLALPSDAGAAKPTTALNSAIGSPAKPGPVRVATLETAAADNNGTTIAQKLPALPALRERKSGWLKFNPGLIFRAAPAKTATKSSEAGAKTQKPVVQPELSLDSVRVLHNDLKDVDVEVVPIKSRTGVAPTPPAKKSLEMLGKRLFGVETT